MITLDDILNYDKDYRTHLINSISGFKSCNLISTQDTMGSTNVAIFSSVFHMGSNPPLLGFINRPDTVSRHTLENIREMGRYFINHVSADITKQAHQTSARYDKEVSEFDATGLTPAYWDDFPIPYVKEANVSIAMELRNIIRIPTNNTLLIIGEIQGIRVPEDAIAADGKVDLGKLGTVTTSGLDAYHTTNELFRLSYAKPDKDVEELK